MLKIALCDDDSVFLEQVVQRIHTCLKDLNYSASIATYISSVALYASVADGERFDIYILDVEMPIHNGFEIAEKIREFQPNAVLLFLTSHSELASEGYKVEAFRYISKINLDRDFSDILSKSLQRVKKLSEEALTVQHYTNYTRILLQDILYVRKAYRCVQIVTLKQGIIKDNRGIKELANIIEDPRFVISDRAYLVNLSYARALEGSWLVMTNGERLPISRPMMPKVKDSIMHLWGEGL